MSLKRRLRSLMTAVAVVGATAALLVALPATVAPAASAQAAVASDFNAGNIIDDAVFYDSNAMSAADVQYFLNQRVTSCRSGYTCLKDYRQNTDNRPVDRYCNGYTGRSNESAAQIIDNVARSCGISQKVLLVLLEKEQSLVTSSSPSDDRYKAATGQGCPDTAPCDSATQGFFYQVYYAARQYEIYRLTASSWGYQAGRWNNILYHFDSSRNCGSARVYIENQATAGLYIYTPYTPNAAALNNLYGTGDSCSTYGNRNFWRLFTDWFGSTHAAGTPIGAIDIMRAEPGGIRIAGWAADRDTDSPIEVHVYVSGSGVPVVANGNRGDVAAAYPSLGAQHGFDVTVPVSASGDYSVCAYAINVGQGVNNTLACRTVSALAGNPIGSLDKIEGVDGAITLQGWALDPDVAGSIEVHVYIDSVGHLLVANGNRGDVGAAYPGFGSTHGFDTSIAATRGTHEVCVFAINVGTGSNTVMTCQDVVVPGIPVGSIDKVSVDGGSAIVEGWALDPDTTGPIEVHVYVAGKGTVFTASSSRPDIAGAFPGYGDAHGFVARVQAPIGTNDVCAYAINDSVGGNTLLGCRSVTVKDTAPYGSFDVATAGSGSISVAGWAIDPDTKQPIQVHVYVGSSGTALIADVSRPDVAAAFPASGDRHGFAATVAAPAGAQNVCAFAINDKPMGPNILLGCRTVQVR